MRGGGEFERRSSVHRTERGELTLSVPAPTVFVFDYAGFTDETFIPFIETTWEREFGSAPKRSVQVFANTAGQTGYTATFRVGMMQWSKRMVDRTDQYVLLVRSRWVAMGIAIVRSTLGLPAPHVDVTSDGRGYREKLDAAVRLSLNSRGPSPA
jgi:hypothetical protein